MVKMWRSQPAGPARRVEETVTEVVVDIPAKTCPGCGKYHRRSDPLCAGCGLKELLDSEPKQNQDLLPCAICGVTHVQPHTYAGKTVSWEKRGVTTSNKPIQGWLCGLCCEVKDRNLSPAPGTHIEELILSVRVLQEYGYAKPWRLRGADPWIRKTVVRDVMMANPGYRPKIAVEMKTYASGTEMRPAVAFLGLDRGRLDKYMTQDRHKARPAGSHQRDGRTIDNLLADVASAEIEADAKKRNLPPPSIHAPVPPGVRPEAQPVHDQSWRTVRLNR